MTLGEKIQILRKQSGMSQEQLAAKLLVTRQAISRWELSESLPDVDNIVQLSTIFNVTTDYLLKNGVGTGETADVAGLPHCVATPETPTHAANIESSAKHTRKAGAKKWSPMMIGVIGTIVAGMNMLSRIFNYELLPIAGLAAIIGFITIVVPQIQALSTTHVGFKLGKGLTDISILAMIISGLFFSRSHAMMVLDFALIAGWAGLAVAVFCIIRHIIREHSRSRPPAPPMADTDELAKILQPGSKQQ